MSNKASHSGFVEKVSIPDLDLFIDYRMNQIQILWYSVMYNLLLKSLLCKGSVPHVSPEGVADSILPCHKWIHMVPSTSDFRNSERKMETVRG